MPGRQEQEDNRQELRQADQTKIEWLACDLIDLPAHGDRLHLQGGDKKEARHREQREIGVAEGNQPRMRV